MIFRAAVSSTPVVAVQRWSEPGVAVRQAAGNHLRRADAVDHLSTDIFFCCQEPALNAS
jgi:hypothetical protein